MQKIHWLFIALFIVSCTSQVHQNALPGLQKILNSPPSTLPQKPLYEPPPTPPTPAPTEIKLEAHNPFVDSSNSPQEVRPSVFLPGEITVHAGDLVRLTVLSTDTNHTFTLPAYGIDEKLVQGQDVTIQFLADKAGVFDMYSKTDPGFDGKFIVK